MLAKTDKFKTRKITDMFSVQPKEIKSVDDQEEEPSTSSMVSMFLSQINLYH